MLGSDASLPRHVACERERQLRVAIAELAAASAPARWGRSRPARRRGPAGQLRAQLGQSPVSAAPRRQPPTLFQEPPQPLGALPQPPSAPVPPHPSLHTNPGKAKPSQATGSRLTSTYAPPGPSALTVRSRSSSSSRCTAPAAVVAVAIGSSSCASAVAKRRRMRNRRHRRH